MPPIPYERQARRERFAPTASAARDAAAAVRRRSDEMLADMRRIAERDRLPHISLDLLSQTHAELQALLYLFAREMDDVAEMEVPNGEPNIAARVADVPRLAQAAAAYLRLVVDHADQPGFPQPPALADPQLQPPPPEVPPSALLASARAAAQRLHTRATGFASFLHAMQIIELMPCLDMARCVRSLTEQLVHLPNYSSAVMAHLADLDDVLRAAHQCTRTALAERFPGTEVTDAFIIHTRRQALIANLDDHRHIYEEQAARHPHHPHLDDQWHRLEGGMQTVLAFLDDREAELARALAARGFEPTTRRDTGSFAPISVPSLEATIASLFTGVTDAVRLLLDDDAAHAERIHDLFNSDRDSEGDPDVGPVDHNRDGVAPDPDEDLAAVIAAIYSGEYSIEDDIGQPAPAVVPTTRCPLAPCAPNNECSICLEPLDASTKAEIQAGGCVAFASTCGHAFHRYCIAMWLARGRYICPNCMTSTYCSIDLPPPQPVRVQPPD